MKPRETSRGVALQWFLGALLAITLTAFFLSVVMVQLTSAGSSQKILRREVATVTGIASLLPLIEEDIGEAMAGNASGQIQVPNFPIPVLLDREEAGSLRGAELKERLLDEAAATLYREGQGAWSFGDPDSSQDLLRFSSAGALHRGFGVLTEDSHTAFTVVAIVLAALAGLLAFGLLMSIRSYTAIIVLGVVTAGVSLLSLAGALALHLIGKAAASQMDSFVGGLLDIAVDSMTVLVIDYSILLGLGLALAALGLACGWLDHRLFGAARTPTDGQTLSGVTLREDIPRRSR